MYANWNFAAGHKGSPSALPAFALTARGAADVQAAVRFAASRRVRLSVKSTGHSYTGRSTAAGSLLVFLHAMQNISFHHAFDDGCEGSGGGEVAVSVEPGVTFGALYAAVDNVTRPLNATPGEFAVVGGGGSTVSAAGGYMLGGGHSVLSRSLGLAADNVLALELVLPNGTHAVATRCANSDVFWAARGGGGGTFGVLLRATHRLHRTPRTSAAGTGVIGLEARYPVGVLAAERERGAAWLRDVIAAQPRVGPAWGCYLQVLPAVAALSRLATWKTSCLHWGGDAVAASAAIAPLRAAFAAHPAAAARWATANYSSFWDWKRRDDGGDTTGVATVLSSRILPPAALNGTGAAAALADVLLGGVAKAVNLQIALVLGGAAARGDAQRGNGVSPHMRRGLWHIVGATGWLPIEPEAVQERATAKVRAFGAQLRSLAPESGAYVNEDDYAEPGWRESFFGSNYERLLAIKAQLDPAGLLTCRNCVGSNDVNASSAPPHAGQAASATAKRKRTGTTTADSQQL
eukprot:g5716.t1